MKEDIWLRIARLSYQVIYIVGFCFMGLGSKIQTLGEGLN